MEFSKVVKKRKSVNAFSGKKASWKDVLEAIDDAIQGPFAGNHNNLRFLIVEDGGMIKELAGLCEQNWINESGLLVVVCSDDTHLENIYGERGRIYSRQQAGAAIQTFLLKLTELGLSSCWVGSYADEIVKEKLKIPQHIQVEAIVPIGYERRVKGAGRKPKKKLESVLYWEEWDKTRKPAFFRNREEDYDAPEYR